MWQATGRQNDRLIGRLAHQARDKRMLILIRAFLMEKSLVSPTTEGTPQCDPLSW